MSLKRAETITAMEASLESAAFLMRKNNSTEGSSEKTAGPLPDAKSSNTCWRIL